MRRYIYGTAYKNLERDFEDGIGSKADLYCKNWENQGETCIGIKNTWNSLDSLKEFFYNHPQIKLNINLDSLNLKDKPLLLEHGKKIGTIIGSWLTENDSSIAILAEVLDGNTIKSIDKGELRGLSIGYIANVKNDTIETNKISKVTKNINEVSVCKTPFFDGCEIHLLASNSYKKNNHHRENYSTINNLQPNYKNTNKNISTTAINNQNKRIKLNENSENLFFFEKNNFSKPFGYIHSNKNDNRENILIKGTRMQQTQSSQQTPSPTTNSASNPNSSLSSQNLNNATSQNNFNRYNTNGGTSNGNGIAHNNSSDRETNAMKENDNQSLIDDQNDFNQNEIISREKALQLATEVTNRGKMINEFQSREKELLMQIENLKKQNEDFLENHSKETLSQLNKVYGGEEKMQEDGTFITNDLFDDNDLKTIATLYSNFGTSQVDSLLKKCILGGEKLRNTPATTTNNSGSAAGVQKPNNTKNTKLASPLSGFTMQTGTGGSLGGGAGIKRSYSDMSATQQVGVTASKSSSSNSGNNNNITIPDLANFDPDEEARQILSYCRPRQ